MTYTLHQPPDGLTGWPRLIWPLVYVQLMALKAWVRKQYGPGVPYWYEISRWGIVSLKHMPIDFTWSYSANAALQPTKFDFTLAITSPRLASALAEEAVTEPPAPEHGARPYSVPARSCIVCPDTS
jgi:hypothetical protein